MIKSRMQLNLSQKNTCNRTVCDPVYCRNTLIQTILCIDCTTIVTQEMLRKVYTLMQMGSTNSGSTQSTLLDTEELDPEQHLYFINAMEMPRVVYSAERKVFEK